MKKKLLAILLIFVSLFILMGCGSDRVADYWNSFVNAINNKDIEYISNSFGLSERDKEKFVAENEEYYKSLPTIETKSITKITECNFSGAQYINNYYQFKVDATIGGESAELMIYLREDNKGFFFCPGFNFTNDEEPLGNTPDKIFLKSVYYQTDTYVYCFDPEKPVAYYVQSLKNEKDVVIPEQIEGVAVAGIQTYAFYKSFSILSFTISTSKLRSIVLPETLLSIGDYAFHQCKKLTEIRIPASVQTIGVGAFSGCSKLSKIYLDVETADVEGGYTPVSEKAGSAFAINGGRNMLVGDIITLTTDRPSVTWSVPSNASTILTIDPDTGVAKAIGNGKAVITAMDNATKEKATIEIDVKACPSNVSINYDAFDRLTSLKAIYINAINPNTIKIANGNQFSLSVNCKIYVPEESVEMYKASSQWSAYANQIVGN